MPTRRTGKKTAAQLRAEAEQERRRRYRDNPLKGQVRPLVLRGNVKAAQTDRSRELCLVGPAGTSKTVGNLQKLHTDCLTYPGMRVLLLRKFRADLTESVLQTFEEDVLPPGSPLLRGPKRENRFKYQYPNGAVMVCGGMDLATRLFSAKYDRIYCCELIEFDEADYETLLRCLRSFKSPYRQILADTNPGAPTHWIKLRAESGKLTLLPTYHADNPFYWDELLKDWTPEGREYVLETLSALSGVRRLRLLLGLWAAAEGVIYEEYDAQVHHIPAAQVPWHEAAVARRIWSVDFGYYPDPFVWQNWLIDSSGRMYLLQEIYQTKRLVKDLARDIVALTAGQRRPDAIVTDHARGERATLEHYLKQATRPAYKDLLPGIQNVQDRLRVQGDGLARLFVMQGATWKPDQVLKKAGRPWSTAGEFESYIWHPKHKREVPLDRDNHGMDAMRYAAAEVDQLRVMASASTPAKVHRDVYGAGFDDLPDLDSADYDPDDDAVLQEYLQQMRDERRR